MKTTECVRGLLNLVTVSLMFVLAALSAEAQQITGVPVLPARPQPSTEGISRPRRRSSAA